MNQILYKGKIFGGVGEDVTNKQYDNVTIHNPITDQDETYTPIGGENAEIFNCYKGENTEQYADTIQRNIATGKFSFITGRSNKELTEDNKESKDNIIIGHSNIGINNNKSFIMGQENFVKGAEWSFIGGTSNKVSSDNSACEHNFIFGMGNEFGSGYYNGIIGELNKFKGSTPIGCFMTGSSNEIIGSDYCSLIYGSGNTLKNNIAGGLLVGGQGNTVKNSYQGIVCGTTNMVYGAQSPAVFGQNNIVGDSEYPLYGIASGGMVSGKGNRVKAVDSGIHVLGRDNEVDSCANGTLVCGDSNVVSYSHHGAIIGGYSNNVQSNSGIVSGTNNLIRGDYNIIGGNQHTVSGSHNIVGGSYNLINSTNYSIIAGYNNNIKGYSSLIIGAFSKIDQTYSSIISGYQTSGNSIEAHEIDCSLVQGKNIRIGRFSQKIGITTDITTSPISLMTGYTTEQHSYGGVFNGYLIYNEYNSYTKDEDTIYYIVNTKYFYREGGYTWNISDYPPSDSTYLGTTITNISEGSTQHDFSIITSVEYNATISSFEDYDILQICNSTNYSLENKYYYSNSQWNEQTYEFGPFNAYNCLISGVNIEARGGLKSCEIFGDNQIISAAYTSANGVGNNISGSYVNINGSNNTISGFQITCYGSQNNASASNVLNIGDSNSFGGSYLYNIGNNNILQSGNLYNIGNNNAINGRPNTLSIGQHLNTNGGQGGDTELLLGKYNALANKLLILGNGTADNNRSNALEIDYDGSQIITLKDTSVTGLGIGKITINQQNIIFESLKDNSNNEKETVEFTFEDLQSLKNIAPAQNINNTPFPQI